MYIDNVELRCHVQEYLREGLVINITSPKFSCEVLRKILQADEFGDLDSSDIIDIIMGIEGPLVEDPFVQILESNINIKDETYERIFRIAVARKWLQCMQNKRLIKQQKWTYLIIVLQRCFMSTQREEIGYFLLQAINGMTRRTQEKQESITLQYAEYFGIRHEPLLRKSPQVLDTDKRIQYIDDCFLSCDFCSRGIFKQTDIFNPKAINLCESCTAVFYTRHGSTRNLQNTLQLQYLFDKETKVDNKAFCEVVQGNNIILAVLIWKRRSIRTNKKLEPGALYEPFTLTSSLVQNFENISPSMQKWLREIYVTDFFRVLGKNFHYVDLTMKRVRKDEERKQRHVHLVAVPNKQFARSGPATFRGIPVLWRRLTDFETRQRYEDSPSESVSGYQAEKLFVQHTNLNIVSASMHREIGSKLVNITFPNKCITLYCWVKGYIPVGEKEFPTRIGTFPVDVREGYFQLAAGKKVKPGRSLRRSELNGTLGGFVEKGDNLYALTCAHVLLNADELRFASVDQVNNKSVFMCESENVSTEIGTLEAFSFEYADKNKVSVDAALIRLNTNRDVDHHFPKAKDETQEQLLWEAGFKRQPVYDSGEVSLLESVRRDLVIKYGITTGFTVGHLHLHRSHARVIQEKLKLPPSAHMNGNSMEVDYDIKVFNQIEVREYLSKQFFDIGDSGSLVFRVLGDEDTLQCIGLAIGLTSYGTCVVTPIQEVLQSLDRKIPSASETSGELRMKTFRKTMQHPSGGPNLNAVLSVLTGEMSKLRSDIRQDVSNLEKRIDNRLSSIESDIKQIKDVVDLSPSQEQHDDSSDEDL